MNDRPRPNDCTGFDFIHGRQDNGVMADPNIMADHQRFVLNEVFIHNF